MIPRRPRLALLLVPVAVAACGGASSSSAPAGRAHLDARQVVLLSAQKVSSTSFTMSMSFTEDISSSASLGSIPSHLTMQSTGREESPQRSSFNSTIGFGGSHVTELVTAYDGTIYISSDNGVTWKTTTLNAAALTQYGPSQVLGFLKQLATVTDAGPTTADGQAVEQYRAVMDPAKTKAAMESVFANMFSGSSIGGYTSAITSALSVKTGVVSLTVNGAGLPVTETFDEDLLFNLSALGASLNLSADQMQGLSGTIELHITGTASYADFGTAISITKPAHVTGSLLPSGS